MPLRLTAVILTKNESENIADCVAALKGWTDAVVVWDSCSQDDTRRVALDAGARVIARPFDDYGRQRQAALDSINSEWILFVDADERATPALAKEVLEACQAQDRVVCGIGDSAARLQQRIDEGWQFILPLGG